MGLFENSCVQGWDRCHSRPISRNIAAPLTSPFPHPVVSMVIETTHYYLTCLGKTLDLHSYIPSTRAVNHRNRISCSNHTERTAGWILDIRIRTHHVTLAKMGHRQWNFDIDQFLNYVVIPAPWQHLPYPIARFFGYRREKPPSTGNLMPIFWAFVGIWCAIAILEQVTLHVASFQDVKAPGIVGSFVSVAEKEE